MGIIVSNVGKKIVVDDEDLSHLSRFKWRHDSQGYVVRSRRVSETQIRTKNVYMHREIMGFPDGLEIDHINLDKLDNRKENLRICTRLQNARNQQARSSGKWRSRYKGVTWHSQNKMWIARVRRSDGSVWEIE
jgi:hypothetical protein